MITELLQSANQVLDSAKSTTVVLIGDFCLDVYYHINSADLELSLETGLSVRKVNTTTTSLGGAGNVFANLSALQCQTIIPIGVIGDDMFGNEMLRLFSKLQKNFTNTLIVQEKDWVTPTYMKPILDGKEQERIDTGAQNKVSPQTVEKLLSAIEKSLESADVVLINQQLPNSIYTKELIDGLNRLAEKHPEIPFIADTRNLQSEFKHVWHKLNTHELAGELGIQLDPRSSSIDIDELHTMMTSFHKKSGDPLIVSRGEQGAIAYNETFEKAEGLSILSELDTVGAGDSFLSGFALSMAGGVSLNDSLYIANSVAGVTIQKLHQTGTCSPDELLRIIEGMDLVYNSDAHPEMRSEPFTMEVISDWDAIQKRPPVKYAVFDHDGTISVLREGWEDVMLVCMMDAITGGKTYDETILTKIQKSCLELISRTTGIQTINQMMLMLDLIKKWGFVPEKEIKTPIEYKKIYNDALLAHIAKRVQYVKSGELSPEDVTMSGSIKFLKTLHENGVQIYLASGTDLDDVKNEAGILGYADYFTGGIYGSVGDPYNDPKRKTLKEILAKEEIQKEQLVVFGDGPVEMREARKNGALAIGIASNEMRRFGWNYSKRQRLVSAGADILIPDMIEYKKLASMLLKN